MPLAELVVRSVPENWIDLRLAAPRRCRRPVERRLRALGVLRTRGQRPQSCQRQTNQQPFIRVPQRRPPSANAALRRNRDAANAILLDRPAHEPRGFHILDEFMQVLGAGAPRLGRADRLLNHRKPALQHARSRNLRRGLQERRLEPGKGVHFFGGEEHDRRIGARRSHQVSPLQIACEVQIVRALLGHGDSHPFAIHLGDRPQRRPRRYQVRGLNLEVRRRKRDLVGPLRSAPRNATSQAPVLAPSANLPAPSYETISTATFNRRPSSFARSKAIPFGLPVAGSLAARRLLPKLIPARSLPVGARSERAAGATCNVDATEASNTVPCKASASLNMVNSSAAPASGQRFHTSTSSRIHADTT